MRGNANRARAVWPRMETRRTLNAFDAVAWRPPSSTRFNGRPANDYPAGPTFMEELRALPRWVVPVAGGVMAALMGAMLGGALHI